MANRVLSNTHVFTTVNEHFMHARECTHTTCSAPCDVEQLTAVAVKVVLSMFKLRYWISNADQWILQGATASSSWHSSAVWPCSPVHASRNNLSELRLQKCQKRLNQEEHMPSHALVSSVGQVAAQIKWPLAQCR